MLNKIVNRKIIPDSHHTSNLTAKLKNRKRKRETIMAQKTYNPKVENYNIRNGKYDITEHNDGFG